MQAPYAGSGPPAAAQASTAAGGVDALEYLLRLAFFAVVPAAVVVVAELVPMTAALVNMALALGSFFLGEVLRKHAEERGWLGAVLRRQLAFEAYYREHPPKPFVYYLFYPLLFPYWLAVREARREFWLFKGYTLLTFAVLVVSGLYRLVFVYAPELGPKDFLVPFAIGFVIETVAVVVLIMPMTTSVVALHRKNQSVRLAILLLVGLLSCGVSIARVVNRHRTFPSIETRWRVAQRTSVNKVAARTVGAKALHVAWQKRREKAWGREDDGLLAGPALDAAREALEGYYRADEAAAFEIWTTAKWDKSPMMVLYAEGPRKGRPVYMAMRADGTVTEKIMDIPKPARKLMRTIGEL